MIFTPLKSSVYLLSNDYLFFSFYIRLISLNMSHIFQGCVFVNKMSTNNLLEHTIMKTHIKFFDRSLWTS